MPHSLPLPVDCGRQLLACGAELKNTFCLARGRGAWVSHHIGDLERYETLCAFTTGIDHLVLHDTLVSKNAMHRVVAPLVKVYSDVGALVAQGTQQG